MEELLFAASLPDLLPKDLSWMANKNWFLVSENSGSFFYPDEWQTCC